MGEVRRSRLREFAPWRDDVSWQLNGLQGAAGVLIGLYLLFATTQATGTLAQIIGAYIAGVSIMHLAQAVWDPSGFAARPTGLLRRAVGLIGGALVLVFPWLDFLSTSDARWIISGVLVLGGVISIAGAFSDSRLRVVRWGNSLSGLVEIALGVVFFFVTDPDRPLLSWFGVAMLVAGVVLLGRAVLRSGVIDGNRR
jgi:uncharacterized membrane protein HdeD (DUF308 family)